MSIHVTKALARIQKAHDTFKGSLFCGHSGGKDSTVILDLALKVDPGIKIIHNSKDSTHLETILFLYELSKVHTVFFVPGKDMQEFLESNDLSCQIDGTRIAEATREDGRSVDLISNGENLSRSDMRLFENRGLYNMSMLYPIYDWSDEQIWTYIVQNNIPVSKEYKGNGYV
jgi:3'-phosphoadenosine 5'-phosphosulfate sulfotransferase (PAPS reductase)/FAD synthetase